MTVGPIDWGAHDPDLVERVLSVMLLQERRHAWRRERSRGDGGVDVADVVEGGHEVFQIKSFTGSLTTRRKTDIRKSYGSALAGGSLDRPIVAWRLLLPMDPSKEAEKWFRELTKDAPFECTWLGKSRVDLLASRNPHVVDYYLRDGRARIEQRYRDLLRLRDIIESADAGPRPAEITEGLRQLLEGLNRDDPHYAYSFEASHDRPPIEGEMRRPGLVMTMTECIQGRGCVTVRVFAKHRHALEERPVDISFSVEAGSDAHVQLQRAFDFGSTAELVEGVTGLSVSAPGGMAVEDQAAELRLSAHPEEGFVPFTLTFAVVDEAGDELARTSVAVTERRAGVRGRELTCIESGGTFSLKMQIANPPFKTDVPVSLVDWEPDFWGKPAVRVRDGVGVLAHLAKPNALIVSLEPGERHLMTLHVGEGGAPLPRAVKEFVDDLATLQRHSNLPLSVPTTITIGDVRRVRQAAQLTAGTIIDGDWSRARMIVEAKAVESFLENLLAEPHAVAILVPFTLHVGDQHVEVGNQLMRFASARAADPASAREAASAAANPDVGVPIALEAGEDTSLEILWVGDRGDHDSS